MADNSSDSAWTTLMAAPWGQQTPAAKAAKNEALFAYRTAWEAWRDRRVAEGRWIGKAPAWADI